MERREAVELLKELVASNMLDASWVSLGKKNENNYRLEIKSNSYDTIIEFAKSKNLHTEINIEKGFCIIFKKNLLWWASFLSQNNLAHKS